MEEKRSQTGSTAEVFTDLFILISFLYVHRRERKRLCDLGKKKKQEHIHKQMKAIKSNLWNVQIIP